MYQLLKITGVAPEQTEVLNTGDDFAALYAERDRLQAASSETLTDLRYAVRSTLLDSFRPAETNKKGGKADGQG